MTQPTVRDITASNPTYLIHSEIDLTKNHCGFAVFDWTSHHNIFFFVQKVGNHMVSGADISAKALVTEAKIDIAVNVILFMLRFI